MHFDFALTVNSVIPKSSGAYEQCGSRLVQRKQLAGRLLEQHRHERQRLLPLIVLIIRQHLCLRYRRLLWSNKYVTEHVAPCYRRFCIAWHIASAAVRFALFVKASTIIIERVWSGPS